METYVRIYGIASKKVENLLFNAMDTWRTTPNSCIIFVDFSDFDIPIGTYFTMFAENEEGTNIHYINGELVQVTQSFLKPYGEIPRGHKTICEIKCDEESANLLKSRLPIVDSWILSTQQPPLRGTR